MEKTRDVFKKIRDSKGEYLIQRWAKMSRTKHKQKRLRRHEKAFLSDQCKEIKEHNRMGKTRDVFKKIRDTKGTFQCKDGLNKGQKWYRPKGSRRY